MHRFAIAAIAVAGALGLSAETWYPAPGQEDLPDGSASPFAVRGGTLRFNGSQYPKSFNGYVDNNTYTMMTFDLMYETLLCFDGATYDLAPGLARRWAVSDDRFTFTFEIDGRAKWSDGEPVSAEDVLWTYDQILIPANQAGPYQSILRNFERPVVSGPEYTSPSGRKFHRTISFKWKGDRPSWRALQDCGTFEILPKHAFEGKKFPEIELLDAVVSGPYRLSAVEYQVESTFTRRPDWWREGQRAVAGTMNFDKIVIRYYNSNENAFEALQKKKIDVYAVYSAHIMANETFTKPFVRNWIAKHAVLNSRPCGFQGFAMNMRRPPFDDVRVRRAMAMLLDRETMNRTLMYGTYFLHRSYIENLYSEDVPCTNRFYGYDPAQARRLLAEAGWKRNAETGILEKEIGGEKREFRFTFLSRSPGESRFLLPFRAELKKCGIEMGVKNTDFAGWMRDMDEHSFDMTWASWGGTIFPNPRTSWHSSLAEEKSSNNLTGFKSAEMDSLIEQAEVEFDREKRDALFRKMDRLLTESCPYVLLWNISATRLLYWNKFGMPEGVLSKYGTETAILAYWWADENREADLAEAEAGGLMLPSTPYAIPYRPPAGTAPAKAAEPAKAAAPAKAAQQAKTETAPEAGAK